MITEMMLYRVNLPYACYGLIVDNGRVTEAPPIAKWMEQKRKTIEYVMLWIKGKGGTVELIDRDV